WWERDDPAPARRETLPRDFGEATTWTLDWALLASFRARLALTRAYNERAQEEIDAGVAQAERRYRFVRDIICAPEDFLPVTRIIDYDRAASEPLIAAGYAAAEAAFRKHFPAA
ncbi:MAG: hypothetical protein JW910_00980, partial [Anaerolineae bacterium]|nr:hypothetical protein [Anaerolineae bacterium]